MPGAGVITVPAPIGGLNAFDSLFGMPEGDAIQLINWYPQVYGCYLRKGYVQWSQGVNSRVQSLYAYHTNMGLDYLYAFANLKMYNATSPAPAAPVEVISGLATNIWQATMFANSAGTHKVLVSGEDNPIWIHEDTAGTILYDRLTAGDGTAPGTISGFDPADAVDITIHQKRIWFTEKDSTFGWYLPPDQVYGVAAKFDFGPLFKRGGFLQSIATWTVDDGDGADDLLVAFGSKGDVAVYKGIDPNTIDTWALQGVYYAGEPIPGHRFYAKVSGDLKFLTQAGLISMNDMLTSTRVSTGETTVEARNVQQFLQEQTMLYGFLQGWDMKFVPALNMLIINIPSVVIGGNIQLVENVVNTKWAIFRGMDASCWVSDFKQVPFFGGEFEVQQAWTGHVDDVSIDKPVGEQITALVQQSYNYYGTATVNKQVGMFRPNFLVEQTVAWKAKIAYDFSITDIAVHDVAPTLARPRWDSAIWDQSFWAGGLSTQKQWAQAAGMGFAGSLVMAAKSGGEVIWVNTDYTLIQGGIL